MVGENEYISRSKMLSELRGGFFPQDVVYTEAVAIAKQIIASAPAEEDVVRVVRCEYCTEWGGVTFGNTCRKWSTMDCRVCTKPTDFCSYGKRREESE